MRKKNCSAYEILKHLIGTHDFKFMRINSMHIKSQDGIWCLMYEPVHERLGRIKRYWYTLSRYGVPVMCACEMNEDDEFETKCKKFLDKCFEIARDEDVYRYSLDGKQIVLRKGATLESILIDMDMQVA